MGSKKQRAALGKARMIDALNYLASKIENGELLAETDPVQFLRSTADKIEQMETEVERLKKENERLTKGSMSERVVKYGGNWALTDAKKARE